jgi:hypothetical protein
MQLVNRLRNAVFLQTRRLQHAHLPAPAVRLSKIIEILSSLTQT